MKFFEALDKVSKEKAEEAKKNMQSVQEKNESGEELFEMEKPELKEENSKQSFTGYSKEEVDVMFSELLTKIENIGKVEEKGGE